MEWDEESNDRPLNEDLEQDAAAERLAELESALEQDEYPLSIMKQSWRRRRKKPPQSVKSGSNGKFGLKLFGV